MPRYSIEQQMAMAGKKAQVKAKSVAPKPQPKPAMEPKVKNRIDALTKPAHETKEHHGLLRAVSNVLQRGVNDLQGSDVKLTPTGKGGSMALPPHLTDMYSRLHNASLHLDAHHRAESKGHHDIAAAHLEKATTQLTRVANHLQKSGMSSVKDADGSEFPLHFVNTITRGANNAYRTEKAGIASPKELKNVDVKDTHQLVDIDPSGGKAIPQGRVALPPTKTSIARKTSGVTHTLESSKYKGKSPSYPARIYGPDRKG